ncbi:hypothetical protein D3C81_2151300 [compost metagenome]
MSRRGYLLLTDMQQTARRRAEDTEVQDGSDGLRTFRVVDENVVASREGRFRPADQTD